MTIQKQHLCRAAANKGATYVIEYILKLLLLVYKTSIRYRVHKVVAAGLQNIDR